MRRNRVKEPLRYKGVEYNSYYDLEKELGFRKGVLRERLYRGFTLEQATDIDFKKKYGYTKKIENIKYGGVTYSSFKDLADAYGVDYSNMLRKMSVGYSLEKALDKKGLLSIEFDGKVYKTKAELARDYNISPLVLIGRLNQGWTLEESLGVAVRPNTVIYEGKKYPSLRSLCTEKGISESTVMYRLERGLSLKEAVELAPNERLEKIKLGDLEFNTMSELARHLGMSPEGVRKRIINGIPLDKAVKRKNNTGEGKNRVEKIGYNGVTVKGKFFNSLKEACSYHNISYTTVRGRLDKGYTLEQSLDPDFDIKFSKKKISKLIQSKKVTIDGKEFKNLKEVAKHYGFKYTTIRSRLYRGCSIEQAIDPDFKKKYSKNRKKKKD